MELSHTENVSLFAILPNMKIIAEDKLKSNKVYQITVGSKKKRNGMYIQVKKGETMVKQGLYEGKPNCRLHFLSSKGLSNYCLHKKGSPIVLGFYNPIDILLFKSILSKTINMLLNKKYNNSEKEKESIAKMYFNTIFSAINELGKSGNETICNFLKDSPKKTYSIEVIDKENIKTWITMQSGTCKVIHSQSTILTSQCAIKFNSVDDAIKFYHTSNDERNSIIDNITEVRENEVDKTQELIILKTLFAEAFKYLN